MTHHFSSPFRNHRKLEGGREKLIKLLTQFLLGFRMASKSKEAFDELLKEAIPFRARGKKGYKIHQAAGEDKSTREVTIPKEVIEREANKRDMTVEEFVDSYMAVWYADRFDGVHLRFEKMEESGN